jgi:NAD(P)-dependent dehydrogenase (short-subunit alcohol dehydrogenase family)
MSMPPNCSTANSTRCFATPGETALSAAFYLVNAASAVMREQGKAGRIVNIVSSAALYGNLGQAAYASAKAGLFGLTRVAAMDLADAQITANAVAPFSRARH